MASVGCHSDGLQQRAGFPTSALPLALSCLSHLGPSQPNLAPSAWPNLHHVLCLPSPCPLWLSSLSVAHLKDRRLSGGAGSPVVAPPPMHVTPPGPSPAPMQCCSHTVSCRGLESSPVLLSSKPQRNPCSSTDPGLLRALSRVGPDADWSQSSQSSCF